MMKNILMKIKRRFCNHQWVNVVYPNKVNGVRHYQCYKCGKDLYF